MLYTKLSCRLPCSVHSSTLTTSLFSTLLYSVHSTLCTIIYDTLLFTIIQSVHFVLSTLLYTHFCSLYHFPPFCTQYYFAHFTLWIWIQVCRRRKGITLTVRHGAQYMMAPIRHVQHKCTFIGVAPLSYGLHKCIMYIFREDGGKHPS